MISFITYLSLEFPPSPFRLLIRPYKCKGYAKVWIHVGINSLKKCHTPYDVERCFQMFMKKIEQTQKVSPSSKLIVSPILPTGIPLLNAKAVLFNARLFSVPRHWSILNFSVFADKNSHCRESLEVSGTGRT